MGSRVVITVEGRLDQRWSSWFDGAALDPGDGGTTVLRAEVADQAALHALIRKVADLGLTLLGLTQADDGSGAFDLRH